MRKFLLGGEQQRCAIARAVVNNPKLLFADEPTGALNRKNTKEVLNLLTELNQSGMERAFETADSGEVVAFVKAEDMTGELKEKVETSDLVERVVYYDAICSNGQRIGEHEDGNSAFLMEMREGIEVYNEKLDGFLKNVPELKSGEIYLPLGLRSKLSCEVGDTTTINFIMGVKKKFKIKGFIQEPTQGAMMIGWKQLFISKGDYDMILKECHDIQLRDEQAKELVVDALVKEYSELSDINSLNTGYVSLNGENLYCEVYEIPEKIPGLLEGREPLYDNEIIVTKLVAESLELKIGDEVKVSSAEKEADYMISGIYQSISDTGMTFSMSGKGMERLKGEVMEFQNRYYIIENKTQLEGKSIEVKII